MGIIKSSDEVSPSYIGIYCRQFAKKLFRQGLRSSSWSKIVEDVYTNLEDRYYDQPPSSLAQIEQEYGLINEVIKAYDFSNSHKIRYVGAWGMIWIVAFTPILFFSLIYNSLFNAPTWDFNDTPSLALSLLLTNLFPIFVFVSSYFYYVLLDNIRSKLHIYDPRFLFLSKIKNFLIFLPLVGYLILVNFTLRNSTSGLNQISENSDLSNNINSAYSILIITSILLIVQIVFYIFLEEGDEKKYYLQRYSVAFAVILLPAMNSNHLILRLHYGFFEGVIILIIPIIIWLYMFNKARVEKDSKIFIQLWLYTSLFLGIMVIYNITGASWSFFRDIKGLDPDNDKDHITVSYFYLFMWLVTSIIIVKYCGFVKFRYQLGLIRLIKYKFSKTRILSVVIILLMTLVTIQPTTDYSFQNTLFTASGGGSATSTNLNLPGPNNGGKIIIPHEGDLTFIFIVPKTSYVVYTFVIQNKDESYFDVISDPKRSNQIIIGDIPRDTVTTNPTTTKVLLFSFDDQAMLFFDFNYTIWSSEPFAFEYYIYFKSKIPIFSGWAQLFSFVAIITSFFVGYKPEDGI